MKSGDFSTFSVPTHRSGHPSNNGFTIVELLVVIVVIGIISAITIISYNGIQQKAVEASLQLDLANASNQLKMYQIDNSAYPNSVTDCPNPTNGNMCLKTSGNNVYSSYSANNTSNPQTFTLASANGGTIYKVTNDTKPIAMSSAPLGPAADWLVTTKGDHYGNFFDMVTKQSATVTRTTTKTIFDPSTNHIYDVPAGYLGVNPRSDGKGGSEAVVEEARTNYATHSYLDTDSNSDGLTDGWGEYKTAAGPVTYSRPADAVYGIYSQRSQYTSSSDSNKAWQIYPQSSAVGTFSPGDSVAISVYMKGSAVGCQVKLYAQANDASGNYISLAGPDVTLTNNWQRFTYVYSNLPANTSRAIIVPYVASIDAGDSFDIEMSAAQLEKGNFVTSYIPTTTSTATRNADLVTVPTTKWNMNAGTFVAVVGQPTASATLPRIYDWTQGAANQAYWVRGISGSSSIAIVTSNSIQYSSNITSSSGYDTLAYTFATGSNLNQYINGSGKVSSASVQAAALSSLPSTAYIGNASGGTRSMSGPLSRFVVYSSALSDSDVLTVTNAIKDGL